MKLTPTGTIERNDLGFTVWTDWTAEGATIDRPRTSGIATGLSLKNAVAASTESTAKIQPRTENTTMPKIKPLKVFPAMRLAWLESVAMLNGDVGISREDLATPFGISIAQAGADITEYQSRFPGRLEYNGTAKRFQWVRGSRPAVDRTNLQQICTRILQA